MADIRFTSETLASYRVYSLCCHTLLNSYEELSEVCDIDALIGEFDTELRNSYCGDRYELAIQSIDCALQKLVNRYRSKPGVCEKLIAIQDTIVADRSKWDFCLALIGLRDIGKGLAQDFYREGGRTTNAELMDSKSPPLIFSNVCLSSEDISGFTEPRPISTMPDGIHLPFTESFEFSYYLSYPFLFFHEYASHIYVPRIDDRRFDDGWLIHAIDLFMTTRWPELCKKYPLICAHSNVLWKIWRHRFTELAKKGYEIARDFYRWIWDIPVCQPDIFSSYEAGLCRLLGQMGRDHSRYSEVLTYQQRLIENIRRCQQYGDTDTRKVERAEIIGQLNVLTLSVLGVSFNEICGLRLSPTGDKLSEYVLRSHDKFLQLTWDLASYPPDVMGTLSFHDDFLNLVKQYTQSDRGPLLRSAAENSADALELYEKLKAML